jgi:hypothetical protein
MTIVCVICREGSMTAPSCVPDATPGRAAPVEPTETALASPPVPPDAGEETGRSAPSFRAIVTAIVKAVVRGGRLVVTFVEGFRGRSWDAAAERAVQADLAVFRELRSMSDADRERLEPRIAALLGTRTPLWRSQYAVRAVSTRAAIVLAVAAVVLPPIVVAHTSPEGWSSVGSYLIMLAGVVVIAAVPARVLEMVTGRLRIGLVWVSLVFTLDVAVAVASVAAPGALTADRAVFVAAVAAWAGVVVVLVGRICVQEWNAAALRRAWAAERVEGAVVDTLLTVAALLEATIDPSSEHDPADPYRPLLVTGAVRGALTDAANAVEQHLPTLLERHPGRTMRARATAHEVAAALLELRSVADLPGGRVRDADLARLAAAIEAWTVGSLADLPHQAPEGTEPIEAPSRWAAASQPSRKVLVGVTPLILLVVVNLLPIRIPAVVTDALGPFAVTWLLVSVASVFAPDKISLDAKTLLGR